MKKVKKCKICHSLGDTIKKQYPESDWEKKKCPECGNTAYIYHGERNTK